MIKFKAEFAKLSRELKKTEKQVERATTMAVNKVGFDVKDKLTNDMDRYIDRPTPFTKKAWLVRRSGKKTIVQLKDIQAEYLQWQILGGTQRARRGQPIIVPQRHARINKYGNITGKRSGLIKRKTEFIAEINGTLGVWRRVGGKRNPGLKLIHAIQKTLKHKKVYPVFEIAEKEIKKQYPIKLKRSMEKVFK